MFRSKDNRVGRDFKKGIDAYEARKARESVTVDLRKKDRLAQLQKRRMMKGSGKAAGSENNKNEGNLQDPSTQAKLTPLEVKQRLDNIGQLVAAVMGNNEAAATRAVIEFRRLLSIERKPPIQKVIDTGIVPRLVNFLAAVKNHTLQFEAAWTLTNIASGSSSDTATVVNANAIPSFVALLRSPNAEVREQAVWALGNIAGDSPDYRDKVIGAGGLPALIFLIKHKMSKLTMVRNATWTMSNLCRGKPQPPLEAIRPAISTLIELIQKDDTEVLTDACWALSYISDDNGNNTRIQAVLDAGVAPLLVKLLSHKSSAVKVPALRAVGNIVTGDDRQTQTMLNCNPLPSLQKMLDQAKKTIKKEACWALSNITAGTVPQIQEVLDANLVPPLIQLMRSASFDIKKEAAWAISNITSGGHDNQVQYLVGQGVVPALCSLFEYPDQKIVSVALEGVDNILKLGDRLSGDGENKFAVYVEECGGLEQLENLQSHENAELFNKAFDMLKTHFHPEEEAEAPPMDASADQFSFALTPANTGFGGAPAPFSF